MADSMAGSSFWAIFYPKFVWQKPQLKHEPLRNRNSLAGLFDAVSDADERMAICETLVFAESVSEKELTKAESQVLRNHHGKRLNRKPHNIS